MIAEDWYQGNNFNLVCSDENCAVFKMKEESGEGIMTMYSVFPGCYIIYNDFHMRRCSSGFSPRSSLFCIDHCREGRIEWEAKPKRYTYVSSGDMLVDCRENRHSDFYFPLSHYHGLSIGIDLSYTKDGELKLMDDFSVNLTQLKNKFCPDNSSFIMRASQRIDRIFAELYDLPERVRRPYFKIKLMELLLFLDTLDVPSENEVRSYFYKSQVDKIKEMVELQTKDLSRWYTLDELSKMYSFPLTSMKQCFKGIYGCGMAEYMKTYRMNAAAELLCGSDCPIIEIANSLGYENPGKFSAAFKSEMGMTPSAYRKSLSKQSSFKL